MLDLLDAAIKHWSLDLDEAPRIRPTGLVCRVRWRGTPAFLKVPVGDETHGADVLLAWAGRPAARVIDRLGPIHLLERLHPGTTLLARYDGGNDGTSLAVLATVAGGLCGATTPLPSIPGAIRWGESLLEGARPGACDANLWREARDHYASLAASQGPTFLLHGDLHHDNLLWDDRRGWIAIDPKGVFAEPAFELGCALRNPFMATDTITRPEVVRDRLALLAISFGVDGRRVARWACAQAVLSAAWSVEDGLDPNHSLAVARAFRPFV